MLLMTKMFKKIELVYSRALCLTRVAVLKFAHLFLRPRLRPRNERNHRTNLLRFRYGPEARLER